MPYFTTLTIPAMDVESVDFYIYRDDAGKVVYKILIGLHTSETVQISHSVVRNQLLKHLGLKRSIERIKNWRKRNEILLRAFRERAVREFSGKEKSLAFRCIGTL